MLDLRHVRCFAVLADELHFGRAATRLHMTQSPLSRQIQLLEAELRVPLFVRTARTVELTAAGRAFQAEAARLLNQAESASQAARRAATDHVGNISLGFVSACCYGFLPRLVARARQHMPEVNLDLHEATSEQQLDILGRGRLDMALVRPPTAGQLGPGLASACVFQEDVAAAIPVDHPLARKRRLRLRDLHGERFIMYSLGGKYMHGMLRAAFAAAGVTPLVQQELSTAQSILSLVSAGLGLAVVPGEARHACFANVTFRPIELDGGRKAELHAVWRREGGNGLVAPLRDLLLQAEAG